MINNPLFNPAARTRECVPGTVGPTSQRQPKRPLLMSAAILCGLVLFLGVSRTAVFAEPTITEIEKVVCLVHGK